MEIRGSTLSLEAGPPEFFEFFAVKLIPASCRCAEPGPPNSAERGPKSSPIKPNCAISCLNPIQSQPPAWSKIATSPGRLRQTPSNPVKPLPSTSTHPQPANRWSTQAKFVSNQAQSRLIKANRAISCPDAMHSQPHACSRIAPSPVLLRPAPSKRVKPFSNPHRRRKLPHSSLYVVVSLPRCALYGGLGTKTRPDNPQSAICNPQSAITVKPTLPPPLHHSTTAFLPEPAKNHEI
jgi:hypothetical protein